MQNKQDTNDGVPTTSTIPKSNKEIERVNTSVFQAARDQSKNLRVGGGGGGGGLGVASFAC